MQNHQPLCIYCQHPVKGRADKKFCNDYCRNAHHNLQNSATSNAVRNINHCLQKNRRILENLLPPSRQLIKTSAEFLQYSGFNFQYHTHILTNARGNQFFCCYNYGYRWIDNVTVMVMKQETASVNQRGQLNSSTQSVTTFP